MKTKFLLCMFLFACENGMDNSGVQNLPESQYQLRIFSWLLFFCRTRHCEPCSDEAIQNCGEVFSGLLRASPSQ
jgi:hypothetical protein